VPIWSIRSTSIFKINSSQYLYTDTLVKVLPIDDPLYKLKQKDEFSFFTKGFSENLCDFSRPIQAKFLGTFLVKVVPFGPKNFLVELTRIEKKDGGIREKLTPSK
jgi:hypothetical protein